MDMVIRALAIYFVLTLLFRIVGKRSIAQITTFDFVLLLIIAETTQQALLGNDFSLTNAFVLIGVLLTAELLLSIMSVRIPKLGLLVNGTPTLLVDRGEVLHQRLRQHRIQIDDILEQARTAHGLARMDDVEYAVLERSGGISVIPRRG